MQTHTARTQHVGISNKRVQNVCMYVCMHENTHTHTNTRNMWGYFDKRVQNYEKLAERDIVSHTHIHTHTHKGIHTYFVMYTLRVYHLQSVSTHTHILHHLLITCVSSHQCLNAYTSSSTHYMCIISPMSQRIHIYFAIYSLHVSHLTSVSINDSQRV